MSRTRAGGRSAIVRAKALAAASELVGSKGLQNVTMPEIAQQAGVAATSLYRRWGDVGSLLLDMAVERLTQEFPLPDEGSIRDDLEAWSGRIARGLKSNKEANFLRVLLATSNVASEARANALAPRLKQLEDMLQRGKSRGERTPSADDVVDYVLAPLYMRALLGVPPDQTFAARLVERLIKITT